MANVLLLRSSSTDGGLDKYEDAFRTIGYYAVSVPVLETALMNIAELERVVVSGPETCGLGGVIVTSARACEAWRVAVVELAKTVQHADWTRIPFYVVGAATASALANIHAVAGRTQLAPGNIRGAAEAGTSEKLAKYILHDFPSTNPKKLLYLTGDKNRDTLPSILQGGGIELQSLQVYATQGSSSFAADLKRTIESTTSGFDSWWIVFFAPSAAEFVTPILCKHFSLPDASSTSSSACIAAIGPTTSTFLTDTLKLRVDVLSPKPSPDALAAAIKAFDAPES